MSSFDEKQDIGIGGEESSVLPEFLRQELLALGLGQGPGETHGSLTSHGQQNLCDHPAV